MFNLLRYFGSFFLREELHVGATDYADLRLILLDTLLTNGTATLLDRRYLLLFVRHIDWCILLILLICRTQIDQLVDRVEISGWVIISIQVPNLIIRFVLFHLEV